MKGGITRNKSRLLIIFTGSVEVNYYTTLCYLSLFFQPQPLSVTTTTTSSRLDSNMGSSTQTGAAPASRGSKNRKRSREVKDEINNEIKDEDEDSSALPTHRHRRRRHRNSRSRTPSPSPSLGGNENTPEEEDISPDDLPASLDRHACLRCVRFLASEPAFECEFPARSIKCTRCTRLNSKCEPVSTLYPLFIVLYSSEG
jgi:hypothetical protein